MPSIQQHTHPAILQFNHSSRGRVHLGTIHPYLNLMAQPTSTPQHTDPATKRDEKKNEETKTDKPDGKKKTTQKGS
ncbi:hypothetical protein [Hymenobacter sp. UYP22]